MTSGTVTSDAENVPAPPESVWCGDCRTTGSQHHQFMPTDATIIDTPAVLAGVTRNPVGMIGVDGAVITCKAGGRDYCDDMDDGDYLHRGIDSYGTAWCDTGFGDGGYDIVETVNGDGVRVGLEVAFYSAALETEVDQVVAELWGGPGPTLEERRAAHSPDADAADVAKVKRWHNLHQELWNGAVARMASFDPAAEAVAELIGVIDVPAGERPVVLFGGPGTSGAGPFDLPAGSYTAVAWVEDHTCLRFGLYLNT